MKGRLLSNSSASEGDQLKTFGIVDESVSFCRDPLFRSRDRPVGCAHLERTSAA
jgi:hypothetical protein